MVTKAQESTALVGMQAIADYMQRPIATVMKIQREYEETIPIKKVDGIWESDKVALDKWQREVLLGKPLEKAN